VLSWLISFGAARPLVAATTVAQLLPGADGARLQLLARPPQELEIADIFVYATPGQAAASAPRPNRFPSGTTKLTLDIRVKELRRMGTIIRFEVETTSGPVEMADGIFSFARLEREGVSSMDFDLVPKSGVFADGPYRLNLFMNDIHVAVLNWSVGGT
jgi:hypothetical protein